MRRLCSNDDALPLSSAWRLSYDLVQFTKIVNYMDIAVACMHHMEIKRNISQFHRVLAYNECNKHSSVWYQCLKISYSYRLS